MPLRVTIELVPHGIEQNARVLRRVDITQVDQLDSDPEGQRVYRAVSDGKCVSLLHRRGDGAEALCCAALSELRA